MTPHFYYDIILLILPNYSIYCTCTVANARNPFRLNVGFLINLPVGDSRDFFFDIAKVHLEANLDLLRLRGEAHITRTAQGLLVQVALNTNLLTECVRCLTDFQQPIEINFTELYAFNRNSITESELLLPDDAHINLAPLIREYGLLAIPSQPLCRPECKGLCPICGENQNETTCHHAEEMIDLRLTKLKQLIDKE